jgi:hypothetical protein
MKARLGIADWSLEIRFGRNPTQLAEALSLIQGVSGEEKDPAGRIVITDQPTKSPQGSRLIGNEGRYSDRTLHIRVGGTDFHVSYDGPEVVVQVAEPSPLPYLLPFLLSEMGISQMCPVHACAGEIDGEGILLAGPGGSGRTTGILDLVAAGGKFVSDDFSIVTSDRGILSIGPRVKLVCDLNAQGIAKDNFTPLRGRFKGDSEIMARCLALRVLHTLMNTRIARPVPGNAWRRVSRLLRTSLEIDVRDIWGEGGWVRSTSLDRLLFLTVDDEREEVRKAESREVIRRLCAVNHMEFKRYLEFMEIASFANPELGERMERSFHGYPSVIESALESADLVVVQGSRQYLRRKVAELLVRQENSVSE